MDLDQGFPTFSRHGQVTQTATAGKGTDMSGLQLHHCITLES